MKSQDSVSYYDHHALRLAAHDLRVKSPGELLPFLELLAPEARVLDLGCGSGLDLQWIRRSGREGVGIEAAASRARIAREQNPGAEIHGKNFLFYSPKEAEWDGVWANRSLHHDAPEAVQRVVASVFRGLKPGGIFGVVVYEGAGGFQDREGDYSGPPRFILPWREKPLCSLLEQTGFQIVKVGRRPAAPEGGHSLPSLLILAKKIGVTDSR
jgi:SAM-dependent methyltransferase